MLNPLTIRWLCCPLFQSNFRKGICKRTDLKSTCFWWFLWMERDGRRMQKWNDEQMTSLVKVWINVFVFCFFFLMNGFSFQFGLDTVHRAEDASTINFWFSHNTIKYTQNRRLKYFHRLWCFFSKSNIRLYQLNCGKSLNGNFKMSRRWMTRNEFMNCGNLIIKFVFVCKKREREARLVVHS